MPYVTLHASYNEAREKSSDNIGLLHRLTERAQIIQLVFDKVYGERFDLSDFPHLSWIPLMRNGGGNLFAIHHRGLLIVNQPIPHAVAGKFQCAGALYTIPEWVLHKELGTVLREARTLAKKHKAVFENKRRIALSRTEALNKLEAQYHMAKTKLERENWTGKYDVSVSVNRTAS